MIPLSPDHQPLRRDFLQAGDVVQVMIVVSPTCPPCLTGATAAGSELLAAVPHPDLRVRYVWVPVLPPDDVKAALANAERLAEPRPDGRPSGRAIHYWDRQQRLAHALGQALLIPAEGSQPGAGLAWDVYLAYARGSRDLLQPTFWMHQLAVEHALRLDPTAFREHVELLLCGQT